ncbi:spermatogenesis-associated protein 7 [Hoplias malabaricus]|uniref:spermatogenesis-associated protein 7 n=1 Tax=Hoplias malabaricus TaxID=27720 RepID=UPI003462C268
MGYWTESPVMETKRAVSCGSTGNLTSQHIIKDHMISHYKKIYSAKAAVDCTVPTSMCRNVKYTDQKRREQLKKGLSKRSQSERSLSQRSIRLDTSCSTKNSRPPVRGEESGRLDLGGSVMSSPRFSTSFHSKQIVYSSQLTGSPQNYRPASELSCRSPSSQWRNLTSSFTTSTSQMKLKSFQDPMQKTYSGDVMLKHANCFTEEKPFTPRTLKSEYKSTLSSYRYYTPPTKKGTEGKTQPKFNRNDIYPGRMHSKQEIYTGQDSCQPYNLEQEWSVEESNDFGHITTENKFRESDFLLSSSRVSPEGMRSPIMRKVTAEEEELMYLEFITDVTNDIIARGIYSDRVLERAFARHIDMNKHCLDEVKMRHLLEILRSDLQSPPAAPVMALEKTDGDSLLLCRHKYSSLEQEMTLATTDDSIFFSCKHSDKDTEELNGRFSERADPSNQGDQKDSELDLTRKHSILQSLENHQTYSDYKSQNSTASDELGEQLDELGRNMAESLSVSETRGSQECIKQDSTVKLSDDEF